MSIRRFSTRRRRFSRLGLLSAASLLMTLLAVPNSSATALDRSTGVIESDTALGEGEFSYFVEVRSSFGFDADPSLVAALVRDGTADLDSYGFPVTKEEAEEVQRRIDLQSRTLPLWEDVRSRPAFGGWYWDHARNGVAILQVTNEFEDASLLVSSYGLEEDVLVEMVSHSYADLETALRRLAEDPLPAWGSAEIDLARNGITIEAISSDAKAKAEAWLGAGIPVYTTSVVGGGGNDACTSRGNCTYPMKAGIRVEKGSTAGPDCTMGFQITVSGWDEQFLTAGHCGATGSNNWYHDGLGYVGNEQASIMSSGYDAMRVQMSDTHRSNRVYRTSSSDYSMSGWNYAGYGTILCQSGEQSGWRCGTVVSNLYSFTNSSCSCTNYAFKANYYRQSGDSGSPIVFNLSQGVGLHQGYYTGGSSGSYYARFTPLSSVLSVMGVSLYTG